LKYTKQYKSSLKACLYKSSLKAEADACLHADPQML
jgi:hypothetical protein